MHALSSGTCTLKPASWESIMFFIRFKLVPKCIVIVAIHRTSSGLWKLTRQGVVKNPCSRHQKWWENRRQPSAVEDYCCERYSILLVDLAMLIAAGTPTACSQRGRTCYKFHLCLFRRKCSEVLVAVPGVLPEHRSNNS